MVGWLHYCGPKVKQAEFDGGEHAPKQSSGKREREREDAHQRHAPNTTPSDLLYQWINPLMKLVPSCSNYFSTRPSPPWDPAFTM
jgi:hypothetical protein